MPSMNLQSGPEILDAAQHLPVGATLAVPQVTWDDYERLLVALTQHPRLRVSYDCGTLEIMSPSPKHERYAAFLEDLVRAFAQARKTPLEKFGSTTWKRRALGIGIEPDACYYVDDPQHVFGKDQFDLESDPPPDIAVEIDVTTDSIKKLAIYAALRVPEVWRYDGETLRMYGLAGTQYEEIESSRFLTGLTGSVLAEAINASNTQGQTAALDHFLAQIARPQ